MSDRYDIVEKIGQGGTSQVYKIKDKNSGKEYAFKIIPKRKVAGDKIRNEIAIQSKLDNLHIMKIIESSEDNDNFYIVMELCGENLYDYIKDKALTYPEIADIFFQVVKAVKYLHMNGVYHRDIKLENVVKCGLTWKLIDFGQATKEEYTEEPVGTLDYTAPELILMNTPVRSSPIDIWELGILLYELIYKNPPFMERTYRATYNAILNNNLQFPEKDVPNPFVNLIKQFLIKNPSDRPDISHFYAMGIYFVQYEDEPEGRIKRFPGF